MACTLSDRQTGQVGEWGRQRTAGYCVRVGTVLSYRRMWNLDTSFSVHGTLIISSVPDLLHYSGKFIKSQN